MFFDPLTTWLVVLLGDGLVISSNHVSDSKMAKHYREMAKMHNGMINGTILRLCNKGYSSAEYALQEIKRSVEFAQKQTEFREGYAKLEISPESYEFIVKLCEECKENYYKQYKTFSQIYQERVKKGEPKENLIELHKKVEELHSKANSYQSILDLVEKRKTEAIHQEEEKAKRLAESDSNGTVIIKCIVAVLLVVFAFAICLSGDMGTLGMALLLIGSAIGGYFILSKKNPK